MALPSRHFIGQDVAAPEAITRWCREQWPTALPPGLIFCVPTALAFRRLRDALTLAYGGFHGVTFVQPSNLLHLFAPRASQPLATVSECLCVWDEVFDWLSDADPEDLVAQHLFPGKRDWLQRPKARYAIAQRLLKLRATLVEQCLDFHGVATHPAVATLDEHEQKRWQALDALETRFREALHAHGLVDPTDRQLDILRAPLAQPQETGMAWHLIVACVPDYMPALTRLFSEAPKCDILVQADADVAARFDDHGLPLPTAWETLPLELPEAAVQIAETPSDEARAIDRFLKTLGSVAPSQLCLGILDHEVIPALSTVLTDHGLSVFAPEPLALSDRAPAHLLQALLALLREESFDGILPLLAIREVAAAVDSDYVELRTAYHACREKCRPATFNDALAHLPEADVLRRFLLRCREWIRLIRKDLIEGLRAVLIQVYGKHTVSPTQDPLRYATFDALRELFHELTSLRVGAAHPPTVELLLTRLNELTLRPVRHGADCSYEGRLEILWSQAPILLMAGLNEGLFPDTTFEDPFLPNAFRRKLGLRSDVNRVVRDAYILSVATAQRSPDHLCLLCARTNHRGDWLKPSRLLFRCDAETRRQRARKLFLQAPARTANIETESGLAFTSNPVTWAKALPPKRLSPSALRLFLESPLNYWLKYVLHLSEPEPETEGLSPQRFGVLLHQALVTLPQCTATAANALATHLIAAFHKDLQTAYGDDLDVELLAVRYDAEARLKSVARLEQALRAQEWETCYVETETKAWTYPITINGHTLRLNGQIDRIDRNRKTGALRIIDYKTGKNDKTPNAVHYTYRKKDEVPTWADFQLPIYRLIVRHALGLAAETPVELAYITLPLEGDAQLHLYADPIDEAATLDDLKSVLAQLLALGSEPLPAEVGPYGDTFLATLVAPTQSTTL